MDVRFFIQKSLASNNFVNLDGWFGVDLCVSFQILNLPGQTSSSKKRVILDHLFFLFVESIKIARTVILSLVWAIRGNIALTWPHFLNNIFSKYSRKKHYNSADCFLWRNNQSLNLRFISCLTVALFFESMLELFLAS